MGAVEKTSPMDRGGLHDKRLRNDIGFLEKGNLEKKKKLTTEKGRRKQQTAKEEGEEKEQKKAKKNPKKKTGGGGGGGVLRRGRNRASREGHYVENRTLQHKPQLLTNQAN